MEIDAENDKKVQRMSFCEDAPLGTFTNEYVKFCSMYIVVSDAKLHGMCRSSVTEKTPRRYPS